MTAGESINAYQHISTSQSIEHYEKVITVEQWHFLELNSSHLRCCSKLIDLFSMKFQLGKKKIINSRVINVEKEADEKNIERFFAND